MTAADERIRQLEARKRILAQHIQQQQRKDRTRRLIQIGAIMAHLGIDTLAKAQAVQNAFDHHPRAKAWLDQIAGAAAVRHNQPPERS